MISPRFLISFKILEQIFSRGLYLPELNLLKILVELFLIIFVLGNLLAYANIRKLNTRNINRQSYLSGSPQHIEFY